jgi:hypothetical protein
MVKSMDTAFVRSTTTPRCASIACWRARPSSKDVDRSCSPHKLTVTGPPFLSVMLVRGVDLRPLPIVAGNGRLLDVASDSALQTAS